MCLKTSKLFIFFPILTANTWKRALTGLGEERERPIPGLKKNQTRIKVGSSLCLPLAMRSASTEYIRHGQKSNITIQDTFEALNCGACGLII